MARGSQEEEGGDVASCPYAAEEAAPYLRFHASAHEGHGEEAEEEAGGGHGQDHEGQPSSPQASAQHSRPQQQHDLDPIPPEQRTWTTLHFVALWASMIISVSSFFLVTSIIKSGLSHGEACLAVLLGAALVTPAIVLNGHAGARYGISFPVLARASYGVRGAQIPAASRALVACGWFGINAWIGGQALYDLTVLWAPPSFASAFPTEDGGVFLMFAIFWLLNVAVILWGMEGLRRMLVVKGTVLGVTTLLMLAWAAWVLTTQSPGGMDFSARPATTAADSSSSSSPPVVLRWGAAITSVAGSWATLALNIPDFTRFAKGQRAQVLGQALGLPLTLFGFSFVCILVTAAAATYTAGVVTYSPLAMLAERTEGRPAAQAICLFVIASATLASNVVANLVGPAIDFTNMLPRHINFRRGGVLAALLGVAFCPWRLLASGNTLIYDWLVAYASLLGPVLGVMLADYYVIQRQALEVSALYYHPHHRQHQDFTAAAADAAAGTAASKDQPQPQQSPSSLSRYWYTGGVNRVAVASLLLGVLPNLPGLVLSRAGTRASAPLAASALYSFSWFIGLAVAAVAHVLLTWAARNCFSCRRRGRGRGQEARTATTTAESVVAAVAL